MHRLVRFGLAALLLPVAPLAANEPPGVYALVGGTVHRVHATPLAPGIVIIRNGLIEAVGTGLTPPADAVVIDVSGQHVYPGFFDADAVLRGAAASPPAESPQGTRRTAARSDPAPSAARRVIDEFAPAMETLEAKRSTGVTTVRVAPAGAVIRGQSAVFNLSDGTTADRIIAAPVAIDVAFTPRSGVYPNSLMGVMAYLRQNLLDAQRHSAAHAIYARDPAGRPRPLHDSDLEALDPVLRRQLPIVFHADNERMIRRAAALGEEMSVRSIISGGRESYAAADELARIGIPVLVAVDFPRPPAAGREEASLREIRNRLAMPTSPAELARRNVPFALVSGGASPAAYLTGIRRVIDAGLSAEAALRAVTLTPAEIFGLQRQIGSIERGKIANLFVSDLAFHEPARRISHLFIDGRITPVAREAAERAIGTPSPLEGTWDIVVSRDDGNVSFRMTFTAERGLLRGTWSGERGSGTLNRITVDENRVRFSLTAETVPSGESSDWHFEGELDGDEIRGTVSMTTGTFDFTGSRAR
jgi:imidazolonepropionase-like amidohydrolase